MAAFDLTTKPTSLSLKPGATGSILVVVSNRLGRPVTGVLEGTIAPPSAARWLVLPADLQRRYEADPAATVSYEFKVAVPATATAQAVQFKASVRDALAPDDNRMEGQTVAINVTPDPVNTVGTGLKVPWWVWLVAAVIIVGAGVGTYLVCCANEKEVTSVPDVVGLPLGEAREELKKAGLKSRVGEDPRGESSKDIDTVISQEPEGGSDMPKPTDFVTLRVNTRVPDIELPAESVKTTVGVLGPPLNPWPEYQAVTDAWQRKAGTADLEPRPVPSGEPRRVAQWVFEATKPGTYRLLATYANAEGAVRALDVSINGEVELRQKFTEQTSGWLPKDRIIDTLGEVALKKGRNTLEISCPRERSFPHIGSLSLKYQGE